MYRLIQFAQPVFSYRDLLDDLLPCWKPLVQQLPEVAGSIDSGKDTHSAGIAELVTALQSDLQSREEIRLLNEELSHAQSMNQELRSRLGRQFEINRAQLDTINVGTAALLLHQEFLQELPGLLGSMVIPAVDSPDEIDAAHQTIRSLIARLVNEPSTATRGGA